MAKSNEPIWWSFFSAGGMVAALVIPVLVLITGLWLPLRDAMTYEQLREMVSLWPVQGFLFVVVSTSLLHWAHRFRFTLIDLGVHGARLPIAILCYGSALAGTLWAGWILFHL